MADRNLVLQLLITAKDEASAALSKVGSGVKSMGEVISGALAPLRSFGALLAGAVGLGSAQQITELADAYIRFTNQLRIATKSEEEYQAALASVTEVAQRSNADLASTATLYGKVAQVAQTLGINQQQVADVTELVAKAMQLSGADAGTASAGIMQLGQALATGVLRGDEFNSVFEASPKLIEAMAAGLGVATGDMRAMAEAGQLTSDVVIRALLSQKGAIDEVYGKLPQTVGQAMTGLSNAATLFAGQLDRQTGATQSLGAGLKFLAGNLDAVAALMGGAAIATLAKYAYALKQSAAAALAARAAARDQALAAAAQQEAALATAQGHLAAAQAAANRALAEQRLRQQVVTNMESELGYGVTTKALTAARQEASAAANVATAASQRYATAQAALVTAQGAGTASVGLFARAFGFLTGPAGLILTAVSAFGLLFAAFQKQKPVTDALTVATDQYAATLERMNSAQLNARLGELDAAIKAQTQVIGEAAVEVEKYQTGHRGLIDVLSDSRAGAEILTEKQGALADATEKLRQLEANRKQTLEALGQEQQQQADRDDTSLQNYGQQATAMDRLSAAITNRAKYLKEVSTAQIAETQTLLDKAEAERNGNDVERLTLQLAEQRAAAARTAAELVEGEAVAANLKAGALNKIAEAHAYNNPKEVEAARLAQESAVLKGAEAAQSKALVMQLDAEAQSLVNGSAATQALADKLALLRDGTAQTIEETDRLAEANRVAIGEALKLAQAKGEEAVAARLIAEATREEVESAKIRINQMIDQQNKITEHIGLIYASANADGVYTEAERATVEALKEKEKALGRDIDQLNARLPMLEREARQAEVMAGVIGELSRRYADQATEHARAATVSERYYQTQLNELEGSLRVAQARGDEVKAADLLRQKQQLLIDQAEGKAQVDAQAVVDAQNKLEAYRLEAMATQGLDAAEQARIKTLEEAVNVAANAAQQSQDNAAATREETRATQEATEATRRAAEAVKAAAEADARRKSAGDAVTTALNNAAAAVQALDGDTEALTERFNELQRTAGNSATSMADWMGGMAGAVREVTQEYEGQRGRLDALTETLQHFADTGAYTGEVQRAMAVAASGATDQFTLLNEQDLGDLRSALDSANQKLRDMQQETADARTQLSELNAELLEAQGQDQKAELLRQQLNYQTRLAQIEAQRHEAELLGNTELVRILNQQAAVLNQINDAKVASIQSDQNAQQAGDRVSASWRGAESSIRSAGAALAETHTTATRLAGVNLDGLVKGLEGAAGHATKLRELL